MKKRKPKVWEWILVGGLILMYLFREELHSISGCLPPFLAFVLEFYSEEPGLWFGLLIGLCILPSSHLCKPQPGGAAGGRPQGY